MILLDTQMVYLIYLFYLLYILFYFILQLYTRGVALMPQMLCSEL